MASALYTIFVHVNSISRRGKQAARRGVYVTGAERAEQDKPQCLIDVKTGCVGSV